MKKKSVFLLGIGLGLVLKAYGGAPLIHVAPVGGHPESVLVYGDTIFASNMGVNPSTTPDQDGYISKLSMDGKVTELRSFPPPGAQALNSPMGMAVWNDILYVADVNRIVGYSIPKRKQVFVSQSTEPGLEYLNDLVALDDGRLIVSATNLNRLLVLNPKNGDWASFLPEIQFFRTNGLAFDRDTKTLFVAQNRTSGLSNNNGRLTAISLQNENPKVLWNLDSGKFLDGITSIGNGYLLVSDWHSLESGGVIHIVDTKKPTLVESSRWGQKGLADLAYDPVSKSLVIPALVDGTIHIAANPYPAVNEVLCRSNSPGIGFNGVKIGLSAYGTVDFVSLDSRQCAMGFYSGDKRMNYYRAQTPICGGSPPMDLLGISVTQKRDLGQARVELEMRREPDDDCPNPRFCDPSTSYPLYFHCQIPKQ